MKLSFVGRGPSSKSLLNRAYIIQSYDPDFKIIGSSACDDIRIIQKALDDFKSGSPIFCGQSATAFRFIALRVSRRPGKYVLSGERRLFERPHQTLIKILNQLGVSAHIQSDNQLVITSEGWNPQGDALTFSSDVSSQFASSVLLNSFNLERDLFFSLEGPILSFSYLKMTLLFLKQLGFTVKGELPELCISARQKISEKSYEIEPDMSCLFALACFSALSGQAVFTPWVKESVQPDAVFPSILSKMGVSVIENKGTLKVTSTQYRNGLVRNVENNPDMFPLLAVLCALSEGESFLYGAPHLQFKESDRLSLTASLIQQTGREVVQTQDGLRIKGSLETGEGKTIVFDPQGDHRMAMAGALLLYAGFDVKIKNPECVNKSFPEFWKIIGVPFNL
ncbi:MAG: hypothetical protein OXK80_00990 [Bdellovibrionales bacterium]|nr:hypothetical protein [Bdellovibrionales bacterium]